MFWSNDAKIILSGFEVISEKKKEGLQGKMASFFPSFEVLSKKKKKKRSSGQNGLLITIFGPFSISLIIFICTVLRSQMKTCLFVENPVWVRALFKW